MMEELISSETSLLTRATWRNIPEDAIIQFKLSPIPIRVSQCDHKIVTKVPLNEKGTEHSFSNKNYSVIHVPQL
jgi:hypothetical protein